MIITAATESAKNCFRSFLGSVDVMDWEISAEERFVIPSVTSKVAVIPLCHSHIFVKFLDFLWNLCQLKIEVYVKYSYVKSTTCDLNCASENIVLYECSIKDSMYAKSTEFHLRNF